MADIFSIFANDRAALFNGDSLDIGEVLPENTADSMVTDPPAGIDFMGQEWDSDKGGRDNWIAWLTRRMEAAFRVMKPGAHGLVWALPRTSGWTQRALEDAGFEVRDRMSHLFGQGFPKALDVASEIDELFGVPRKARPAVGEKRGAERLLSQTEDGERDGGGTWGDESGRDAYVRAAVTPQAKEWEDWKTALKPACEDWWLVRKPIEKGLTVAENVLKWRTGAMNIGACRIGSEGGGTHCSNRDAEGNCKGHANAGLSTSGETFHGPDSSGGRWPAHLVISHDPRCVSVGQSSERVAQNVAPAGEQHSEGWGTRKMETALATITNDVYACVPGCPVRMLDAQAFAIFGKAQKSTKGKPRGSKESGATGFGMTATGAEYEDAGGPSRFFYCPKPTRKEKELGLDHLPKISGGAATGRKDGSKGLDNPRAGAGRKGGARNFHPTVKSISLLRYFLRLVTPPGGLVIDPFMGSCSHGVAAMIEGFEFVGIDNARNEDGSPKYGPIQIGRIQHTLQMLKDGSL